MAWAPSSSAAALNAVIPLCGYVSGWGGGPPTELTGRAAVTWPTATGETVDASNQPVVNVPGACSIGYIFLCPNASGGDYSAQAMYCTLDPAIEFTESGTLTLTAMQISLG